MLDFHIAVLQMVTGDVTMEIVKEFHQMEIKKLPMASILQVEDLTTIHTK